MRVEERVREHDGTDHHGQTRRCPHLVLVEDGGADVLAADRQSGDRLAVGPLHDAHLPVRMTPAGLPGRRRGIVRDGRAALHTRRRTGNAGRGIVSATVQTCVRISGAGFGGLPPATTGVAPSSRGRWPGPHVAGSQGTTRERARRRTRRGLCGSSARPTRSGRKGGFSRPSTTTTPSTASASSPARRARRPCTCPSTRRTSGSPATCSSATSTTPRRMRRGSSRTLRSRTSPV